MATVILRPNAAGDETNLLRTPEVDNYLNVDDVVSDYAVTYIYNYGTDWLRDLYNIEAPYKLGTIDKIEVCAYCLSPSIPTQTSLKVAIKSGSTVEESNEHTLTQQFALYSKEWSLNPDTGKAFTISDITSLQVGTALRRPGITLSTSLCTQLYVIVYHTPSYGGTLTNYANGVRMEVIKGSNTPIPGTGWLRHKSARDIILRGGMQL